ncbi:hypothetical protein WSM22_20340 [Cytophagales bacterium WSM2-2]|nr:hypothetical protein WSM22_20340 [Cytophagales bacterium WSM2-2]
MNRYLLTLFLMLICSYAFTQAISISEISPKSGPVGSNIIINGTGFSATRELNIVRFGGVRATVNSATTAQLNVTVPAGCSYQSITVTVNGFTATSSFPFIVTFAAAGQFSETSFGTKFEFSSGSFVPMNMAFADFDDDGKLDIAVSEANLSKVSVFRNTSNIGSLSFDNQADFSTGSYTTYVAAGDLDGDGKIDLVSCNYNGNSVSVLRNTSTNGSISFAAKKDYDIGIKSQYVMIGDIDGDGKPDLITSNTGIGLGNTISIFRNTSTPGQIDANSFSPPVNFTTGFGPYPAAITDLDSDGKPEIIVPNYNSPFISIFKNVSSPGSITLSSLASRVDFPIIQSSGYYSPSITSVTPADIDGDDKTDLIVTNFSDVVISALKNTSIPGSIGASSFGPQINFGMGITANLVAVNDLDGDGKPDVIAATSLNTVGVLKNISGLGSITSGSFAPPVNLNSGTGPTSISSADIDGDGLPDLIMFAGGNVSILRSQIDIASPLISDFSPKKGRIGSTVTISGSNFSSNTAVNRVKFNGVPANVISSTVNSLMVLVPSGFTSGPISVEVTNKTAITSANFKVTPYISDMNPQAGRIGTFVTISGTSFSTSSALNVVKFNGTKAEVVSSTDATISVSVPPGATSGSVTVEINGEIATSLLPFTIKKDQTITFNPLPDKDVDDTPFNLSATSSSGLRIQYSSPSNKVSLAGQQVSILKAGSVTIKADQPGDSIYEPAPTITQTFCVRPKKPVITVLLGESALNSLLGSSSFSGNQWYFNGSRIDGATSQTIVASEIGVYQVKVIIDGCESETSAEQTIRTVTELLQEKLPNELLVYPVPSSTGRITVVLNGLKVNAPMTMYIQELTGRSQIVSTDIVGENILVDISDYPEGMYVIRIFQDSTIFTGRFIKVK